MDALSQSAKSSEVELLPTRPSLLARLRDQNDSGVWRQGWEEFYQLYHPIIYGYARRRGLGEAEAEDVVQEIVIGVARNLPRFEYDPTRGGFKAWLFRIAHNKVVDNWRRSQRQIASAARSTEAEAERMVEIADHQTPSPDMEFDLMWEENLQRAALEKVRARVKPMTLRLYLYHVVNDKSVEQTVKDLRDFQVTADAVHLAKHRVQKMLDQEITRLRQCDRLS